MVTLMTLGAMPEALALGWLRNQRLLSSPRNVGGDCGGIGRRAPRRFTRETACASWNRSGEPSQAAADKAPSLAT